MHHYQSTLNKKKYKEYGICYCIFKILATSDQVWQLIGGFDSLPDWLLYLPNNKVSEGGCVRYLANPDGDAIVERLGVFNNKGATTPIQLWRPHFRLLIISYYPC